MDLEGFFELRAISGTTQFIGPHRYNIEIESSRDIQESDSRYLHMIRQIFKNIENNSNIEEIFWIFILFIFQQTTVILKYINVVQINIKKLINDKKIYEKTHQKII